MKTILDNKKLTIPTAILGFIAGNTGGYFNEPKIETTEIPYEVTSNEIIQNKTIDPQTLLQGD